MTMEWTGPNQGKLRKALLQIYTTTRKLRRFVRDNFARPLDDLRSLDSNPEDWAEELIEKALSEGWLDELYEKFCREHQSDRRIIELTEKLKDTSPLLDLSPLIPEEFQDKITPGTIIKNQYLSQVITPKKTEGELVEYPNSAHLIVTVFWQERKNLKFLVQSELCYRGVQDDNMIIIREPLIEDKCPVNLKKFPEFLQQIVEYTSLRIDELFPDPVCPWKLIIELFVPVDSLYWSLSKWCGQDSQILKDYPVVIGCSDRFDPSSSEAAKLRNKLKDGWQRFQRKVPDQDGFNSKLKYLDWLDSDRASQESLATYSGFRCYGDSLKSGDRRVEEWRELVESGIPLALWLCEGQPDREAFQKIFNSLAEKTRFDFLDQIKIVRDEQRKRGGENPKCRNCLGVFYEDPNYQPSFSRPEIGQFSWPVSEPTVGERS